MRHTGCEFRCLPSRWHRGNRPSFIMRHVCAREYGHPSALSPFQSTSSLTVFIGAFPYWGQHRCHPCDHKWTVSRLTGSNQALKLRFPIRHSFSLLGEEVVALIDANEAGAAARDMPEELLDDLEADAEPLQTAGERAP